MEVWTNRWVLFDGAVVVVICSMAVENEYSPIYLLTVVILTATLCRARTQKHETDLRPGKWVCAAVRVEAWRWLGIAQSMAWEDLSWEECDLRCASGLSGRGRDWEREREGGIGSESGSLPSPPIIVWANYQKWSLRPLFWASRPKEYKRCHREPWNSKCGWKCWMSIPALDLVGQSAFWPDPTWFPLHSKVLKTLH